jgi:hypothetical protein
MPIIMKSQSTQEQITTSTTISIALPSGLVADDVFVANISASGQATCTPPAGWVEIVALNATLRAPAQWAYYKKYTGAEDDPAVFTFSVGRSSNGGINLFSGVDTTTQIDVAASSIEQSSSSPDGDIVVPSITTANNNSMLISGTAHNSGNKIVDSVPSGFIKHWELNSKGRCITFGSKIQPAAGASGTVTWSWAGRAAATGWLCALRSADPTEVTAIPQRQVQGSGQ